jgi:F-type H+-transporting ATPase subunit delta
MKNNKVIEGIISYLKKENLLNLIPELISELKKIEASQIREARVETAFELDETEKKNIKELVEDKFEWKGPIIYTVSAELIGGIKVTVGDQVLDMSTKAKLKDIYDQI